MPKPPPVIPAAGGSSVNTLQLNSGDPFFKTRNTIENRGTRVRSASPTQIALRNLLQRDRTPDRAAFAEEKKSVGSTLEVLIVTLPSLPYSSRLLLGVAKNGLANHVDEQSENDQQQRRVHQRTYLESFRLSELIGQKTGQRAGRRE